MLRSVGPVGALVGAAGFQAHWLPGPTSRSGCQPADGGEGWSHHRWLNGLWGPGLLPAHQ